MRILAISIGSRAPRPPFAGVVHSVFRRACNIELGDGALLTLLHATSGTVPHGIGLAAPGDFDFRDWVQPAQRTAGFGHVMAFDASPLQIDMERAATARTSVADIALDMTDGATRSAWRAIRSLVACAGRAGGLGALLARQRTAFECVLTEALLRIARIRIAALLGATRACDCNAAAHAAVASIGMGPGLTPSWDDFLVGFLAGLRAAAVDDPRRVRFVARLGKAVRAASGTTTPVSRAQLIHAADGHVAEPMVAMLQAMADGNLVGTVAATQVVLQLGHTSGADAALGILCGTAGWTPHALQIEAARCGEFGNPAAMWGRARTHAMSTGTNCHADC